jgi:hypothetical protein
MYHQGTNSDIFRLEKQEWLEFNRKVVRVSDPSKPGTIKLICENKSLQKRSIQKGWCREISEQ